jgi:hypothetical protein
MWREYTRHLVNFKSHRLKNMTTPFNVDSVDMEPEDDGRQWQ